MLITVYQRRKREWRIVKQYYQFRVPESVKIEGSLRVPKNPCPGCGRKFSATAQNQHTCLGGTPKWPRINNDLLETRTEIRSEAMLDYVNSVKHTVVFSDDR